MRTNGPAVPRPPLSADRSASCTSSCAAGPTLLLIAPLDANTLAKLANGLADNCLTCVWRAWDRTRPVVLAPAMNTLMWEHPLTGRHLRQLAADAGAGNAPDDLDLPELLAWVNTTARTCVWPRRRASGWHAMMLAWVPWRAWKT